MIASLVVVAEEDTLPIGTNAQLFAVARDAGGNVVKAPDIEWSTEDTQIALVDSDGVVEGVARGTAVIVAAVDDQTASVEITVVQVHEGVDTFDGSNLDAYTSLGEGAWVLGGGELTGTTEAVAGNPLQLRDDVVIADGWVEADLDYADDAGLVLRFQDNDNYYLLAIRDDETDSNGANRNVQMYRRIDGVFTALEFGNDIAWPRGTSRRFRFEAFGDQLRTYVDGALIATVHDETYAAGGIALRQNSEYGDSWRVEFQAFRWSGTF